MKVSIITVNLNNLQGLRRTMTSVLSQDRSLYEWIVIDGGSIDGSVDLIKQHQKEVDYWISEQDNGIYNAMNKGIAVAKGEYCLFLNSGDFLANNTILHDVFANGFEDDIIYGRMRSTSDGEIMNHLMTDNPTLSDIWNKPLPHQAMFIKSILFERFGLYDETLRIISDWTFYLNAIIFGSCSVRFLPIVIANFEGGGISSTSRAAEEKKLFESRIPARLYRTMLDAISKQEICYNSFFSGLYSILYRAATFFRYKIGKFRS